jgi:hypothetical protein
MKLLHRAVTVTAVLVFVVCDIGWSVNGFSVPVVYNKNNYRRPNDVTTALHAKRVSFKEEARRGLVSGINQVANAVRVTLGPKVRLFFFSDEENYNTHCPVAGIYPILTHFFREYCYK